MMPKSPAPKTLIAVVCSAKMDKTLKVRVCKKVQHPVFKKYVTQRTTYYAHDEHNIAREGDEVLITPSRPLSKTKRWIALKVIKTKEL
jgi:small subunit ribosomal protein S17